MEQSEARLWIEIIAAMTIPIAVLSVIVSRTLQKKGLGIRSIQFLAIGTIPPLVLILALENFLEPGAVGALIGALVGYLFSNFGERDKRKAGGPDA